MITKINRSNSGKYEDLFYQVSQELMRHEDGSYNEVPYGSAQAIIPCVKTEVTADTYEAHTYYVTNENGEFVPDTAEEFVEGTEYYKADRITSLNEYFHYIDRIKAIKDGKYTRLPLDENLFEIDADKRSITVPPAFVQNGISVQSDEVAETLYFKIDRYYDATDLAMQNVFIEWKNAAGETGVSLPWVFDIETAPNYIIFGWPLSSRITGTAGQVQFAVRFYTQDEGAPDRLVYSFSTLTQTATIKPGLAFDIAEILISPDKGAIDDATELISQRFTSSPLAGSNDKASVPIFLDMEIIGFVGPRQAPEQEPSIYMNLAGDNFDQNVTLITEAIKEDAGQLSYSWKRKELIDNKTGNTIPFDSKPYFDMRETEDTAPVDGKTYYQKGENDAYAVFTPPTWDKTDLENYIKIYERFSAVEVGSTGAYWVVARNRVGAASEEVQSATVIIPNPVTPVIPEGKDLPVRETLKVAEDSSVVLTAHAETAVTTENPTGAGVLSYQWKRSDTEDGEFIAVEGANSKTYEILGLYDEEVEAIEVDENNRPFGDGYYKVETTTTLNKESKSIESGICRITHAASKPDIECVTAKKISLDEAKTSGLIIAATFPELCSENHDLRTDLGDKITYQWYRYYAGNSYLEADMAKAALGNYTVNGDDLLGDDFVKNPNEDKDNPDDDFIKGDDTRYIDLGSQTPEFRPDVAGYYFCEVTNRFNGTTAVRCSDFFNVTDY
jgi:hypothetical protein